MSEQMFKTAEAWHRFALPLAFEVSGRPVSIHASHCGAVGQARARLDVSGTPSGYRPERLTIAAEDPQKWRWIIETKNSTKIVVQVLFGTFRESDFPAPPGWVSPLAEGPEGPSSRPVLTASTFLPPRQTTDGTARVTCRRTTNATATRPGSQRRTGSWRCRCRSSTALARARSGPSARSPESPSAGP